MAQRPTPPSVRDRIRRLAPVALVVALTAGALFAALPRPGIDWTAIAPPAGIPSRSWRWLVIHHSGTPSGDAQSIDRMHRRGNGWDGIGYHFLIGNGAPMPRGRIEATFRWRLQRHGAHAGSEARQAPYNQEGIGICVVGDYRATPLDPGIERRLVELCAVLIRNLPTLSVAGIIGHRDVPGKVTDCPGALDLPRLRRLVAARLATLP